MVTLARTRPASGTEGLAPKLFALASVLFVAALFFYTEHSLGRSAARAARVAWFSLGDSVAGVSGGSTRRQVAYALFGLFALLNLRRPRLVDVPWRSPGMLVTAVFVAWCCASLLWASPLELAVRRLPGLLVVLLGVYAIVTRWSPREVMGLVLLMTLGYVAVGFLAELASGTLVFMGRRFGGTLHPTAQGLQCGAMLVVMAWLSGENGAKKFIVLALMFVALALLLMTRTRSAVGATFLALMLLGVLQRRAFVLSFAILGGISVLSAGALLSLNGAFPNALSLLNLGRDFEQAGTLTGRIPLWLSLSAFIWQRPVLGYGYGAFMDADRGTMVASEVGTWAFGGPHNVYVNIALDVGLVGLLLFVTMIVVGVGRAILRRHRPPALQSLFASLVALYALYGMFDAMWIHSRPDFLGWLALGYLLLVPPSPMRSTHPPRAGLRFPHRKAPAMVGATGPP